ncbi:unnamed protein product [Gongylonema pulchrum]|uniref:Uncharacterized protein n=1 Tax=Gongylonema pulchrum TaxID=637853 RepID=A0A183EPX2_9BILA|nr:unnamed protein product [Gongylonema pulchrum]
MDDFSLTLPPLPGSFLSTTGPHTQQLLNQLYLPIFCEEGPGSVMQNQRKTGVVRPNTAQPAPQIPDCESLASLPFAVLEKLFDKFSPDMAEGK